MTLFPAKLDGGGESKVSLFYLVEVGRTQKLRVVTEAGEPDRLDTGVLDVNGGVEIAEKAGKGAGIGGNGLEAAAGEPEAEGMPCSERVSAIAEILPAVKHAEERTQIPIHLDDRDS